MCDFVTCWRQLISFGFSVYFIPQKETQFHISKKINSQRTKPSWDEDGNGVESAAKKKKKTLVFHASLTVFTEERKSLFYVRGLSDEMLTQGL